MNWLELYDEQGRLVGRRPADALPCTIGADASNALVSRAPGVAARHAEISLSAEGRIVVRDLATGVEAELAPAAELVLGGGRLRLASDVEAPRDAAVPPASAAPKPWHDRRSVKIAAPLALFTLGLVVGWWVSTDEDPLSEGLVIGAAVLTFEAIWAGGWALVNRLRFGRARFSQHFAAGAVGTAVGLVLGEVAAWVDYVEPDGPAAAAVSFLCLTLIWLIAFRLHLGVMMPGGPGPTTRRIMAGVALLFGGCMSWAPHLGDDDFTTQAEFAVQLKPLPASLLPAKDSAGFASGLLELEQDLLADRDSLTAR